MRKTARNIISWILTAFMLASTVTAVNENTNEQALENGINSDITVGDSAAAENAAVPSYGEYCESFAAIPLGSDTVRIEADKYTSYASSEKPETVESDGVKAVKFINNNTELTYEFSLEKAARYCIYIEYRAENQKVMYFETAVKINGGMPFSGTDNLTMKIPWSLDNEKKFDSQGNQSLPSQSAEQIWMTAPIRDGEGFYDDPYIFSFNQGVNTITLSSFTENIAVSSIVLKNEAEIQSYDEYISALSDKKDNAANQSLKISAEEPRLRSSSSILPKYDKGSAATEPSDPVKLLYNALGGSTWSAPGDWVEYEMNVPADGFYRLYLRVKQNTKNGLEVKRRIYIDGKVPFFEASNLSVNYSLNWQMKALGGDKPYMIYLTKGKHTLRIEAVVGEYGEIANNILKGITKLNDIYRDIIMITSSSPDTYRDYDLDKTVPELQERLSGCKTLLQAEFDKMVAMGKKGSETSTLEDLLVQIDSFIERADRIPKGLEFFRSNISSLSSWVLKLNEQPLEIDYISLLGKDVQPPKAKCSVWKSVSYTAKSIIGSFFMDYTIVGDESKGKREITVWVSSGRDQAQVINQMVKDDFSKQSDISVKVSLVTTGLVEATLAGNGPDVSLFVASTTPITLAMRGALVDLSKFSNYSEVASRFYDSSLTELEYKNGHYGLPLTQNFPVMFYRTDIFADLGISPPETWEDFYKIVPIIEGQNMNIGMPSMFATLLYQNGGQFYNDDLTAVEFETAAAVKAFTQWNEFYTMYGLPLSFNLYNRFRTGEMPLAIGPYTEYAQLYAAAPEIRNLWNIALIPGTVDENGNVNRTVVGNGGTVAIILDKKNESTAKAAWEFIEWLTRDETQVTYGQSIESRLGILNRYNTANKEAFKQLPTSMNLRNTIIEQWEYVVEVPQMPATYYVTRNINNAFRRVQYYNENPRTTLHIYAGYINTEITRKLEEMGNYYK